MTIDIHVQRGDGAQPGETYVDGLIGSIPVAIARGRRELDELAATAPVTRETVYRDGVRLGQSMQVLDALGGVWTGKITGISHRVTNGQLTTTLRIKRPL